MDNLITFKEYLSEEYEYKKFVETADLIINNPDVLNEGLLDSLSKFVGDKINFVEDLASKLGVNLVDLLKVFKEKVVFQFFTKIKWSIKKLVQIVKKGYKLYVEINKIIAKYIAETGVVKFTNKELKKLDAYLNEHPVIKRTSNLVVAGFLIYQWTSLISFTGDVDFDFDQSALFDALNGGISIADVFSSPDGVRMLLMIATNVLTGVSFPWIGSTWLLFAASIIYTIAKKKYPQLSKIVLKNVKKYKLIKL